MSIVTTTFYSMLIFSMNSSSTGDLYDEILINGRYGIEYIKEEISKADKIIPIDKVKMISNSHKDNLGFVIYTEDIKPSGNNEYKYISYYLGDNKLYRIAFTKNTKGLPNAFDKPGYNIVCDYVVSIDGSNVDFDKGIISLKIAVGLDDKIYHKYKSTIAIRCPIDE